jgi:D-hydroxyproline dehydrogenase subunit gamma
MPELMLDGRALRVAEGTSVAAALALSGDGCTRTSVSGQRRARSPAPGLPDAVS